MKNLLDRLLWLFLVGLVAVALMGLFIAIDIASEQARASLEVLALITLVIITGTYAISSNRLADSAKEQAESSRELAKQSERQLRSTFRPILSFAHEVDLRPARLEVENIGLGPATNVKCWLEITFPNSEPNRYNLNKAHQKFQYPVIPVPASFGDGPPPNEWIIAPPPEPSDASTVSYVAVYQDIYGNSFKSESRAKNSNGVLEPDGFTVNDLEQNQAEALLRQGGFNWD